MGRQAGAQERARPAPRSVSPERPVLSAPTAVDVALRPVPTSAGMARRFVASTLRAWGCDELVDTATLLVSELVTNAILHARSDLVVVLVPLDSSIRVEVHDTSLTAPQLRQAADTATTGRGLALVQACARDWGVREDAEGKSVWFDLSA